MFLDEEVGTGALGSLSLAHTMEMTVCVLSINESLEQIGRALYLLLSGSRERRASEDSWDSRGSLQQTRMGNLSITASCDFSHTFVALQH